MKNFIIVFLSLFTLESFGQQMTLSEWNEEAKSDIRLLPKYGLIPKNAEQKSADKDFIEASLQQYPTKRKASDHLIELGFKYLYKDIKTAMYRFNQAYLLDSTNTDIFWGYGAVYMVLGDGERAQGQYLEGLRIHPASTHLLTDYGTYFMAQYYKLQTSDEKNALLKLDTAINYLTKSYQLDSKDQNTNFKLSICYYQKKDCTNAWKYYDNSLSIAGTSMSEEFAKALAEQCKRTK